MKRWLTMSILLGLLPAGQAVGASQQLHDTPKSRPVPSSRSVVSPSTAKPSSGVSVGSGSEVRRDKKSQNGVQYGLASWYGARAQGRPTASGVPFNEHALMAAHRTLPLGTTVRVTNLRNGRSVNVIIKDRGPLAPSRVIDLSEAAAERIGFVSRGLAPVKVQVLYRPNSLSDEKNYGQEPVVYHASLIRPPAPPSKVLR